METRSMTTLSAQNEVPTSETDMAKAAPNPVHVSRYADALAVAGRNRSAFVAALSQLKEDEDVRANDIIAIALAYRGGGERPRSKAHALEMIERRFVEIVRDAKKKAIASRVRPW